MAPDEWPTARIRLIYRHKLTVELVYNKETELEEYKNDWKNLSKLLVVDKI
jgi:hypothetical protein